MTEESRFDEWQIERAILENNGAEFTRSLLEKVDNEEKARRNAEVMLTSAAINSRIQSVADEVGVKFNVYDDRATGVLALVQDAKGPEAYGKMPGGDHGIHDIDKYFFPENNRNDMSLENLWDRAYSLETTGFERSGNSDNLQHPKYTAYVIGPSDEIECDLVRPQIDEFEDTERVQIVGDLSLTVPSLKEVIRTKGTIERDNGYGYDAFRKKDGEELLALISVAEDRGVRPPDLKATWSIDEIVKLGRRVEDIYPTVHDSVDNKEVYLPSKHYAEKIISWTNYEDGT